MLSHRTFITIISILVISLVLGGFILYQRSNRCFHTDVDFCQFLSVMRKEPYDQSYGIFISEQGEKSSRVNWILNKNDKHIQVITGEKESMNMIISREYVYLKDYRDGLWWRQPRAQMDQYVIELAFDPEVFLKTILERYNSPEISIKAVETVGCGSKQCTRYTVQNSTNETQEYVDIDQETMRLVRYAGKNNAVLTSFTVQYGNKEMGVVGEVKDAEKGQNIFLESGNAIPTDKKTEKFPYLEEFEREMKGAVNL